MASETVASLGPLDFLRETDLGNDMSVSLVLAPGEASSQPGTSGVPAGDIRGLSLPKYKTSGQQAYGYTATFRIPANLTMGTGLTFKVYLTDDGSNSVDLGKNISFGITLKRLAANATDDVDVSAAAEVITACTLSSGTAGVSITSIAIATASLPTSTAVGDLLLIRVRRKGSDSTNDTCSGRVILLRVEAQNT
jgi:hypothetical protein